MACLCAYGRFCREHPKCPWCGNYSTVFESSNNEYSCTRCKKVFTRTTVVNQNPATPVSKDKNIMAKTSKKTVTAKKSSKTAKVVRESSLHYEFVKVPKDAPTEDTNIGCVLAAIRKVKRGSLDDVTESAERCGLETDQDAKQQTRVFLRQLFNLGAVKITRNGAAPAKSAKGKKSFKLVKK